MRKVILNLAVSLDGYIEGPNGEYDWCFADQDYGMEAFFESIDLIFMGRKSYDLISNTGDINAFPQDKYVFSDTLDAEMNPLVSIIRKENFQEKVRAIKEQDGGHIWLFGGAELIEAFLELNMIDEFLLSIHPILLGSGKHLFKKLSDRVELIHTGTQSYDSGLVQVRYVLKPKFDLSKLAGTNMPDLY
ncbi:dihydrofolate reductase family protein [Mucilaginibacter myungsuensis]|uniref:Dihydrofolate reductase n=1 Tax=Mucilaginibacter myungsuensis TaxID=649104 RepID=A0A929KZE2_9SPHI|nr:dihydrofolate reductase family protein [Mucilaginibacter myungsuensis]MBE9664002.1 dihydrofolate reductase [Mucilaginibacter myungsuensis]MDN3601181.1 dihydrofolate reductase family protein [Mucilaginibacter myungsuensis]